MQRPGPRGIRHGEEIEERDRADAVENHGIARREIEDAEPSNRRPGDGHRSEPEDERLRGRSRDVQHQSAADRPLNRHRPGEADPVAETVDLEGRTGAVRLLRRRGAGGADHEHRESEN